MFSWLLAFVRLSSFWKFGWALPFRAWPSFHVTRWTLVPCICAHNNRPSQTQLVCVCRSVSCLTCDQAFLFLQVREGLDRSLSDEFLQPLTDREEKNGLIAGYFVPCRAFSARVSFVSELCPRLRELNVFNIEYWICHATFIVKKNFVSRES